MSNRGMSIGFEHENVAASRCAFPLRFPDAASRCGSDHIHGSVQSGNLIRVGINRKFILRAG